MLDNVAVAFGSNVTDTWGLDQLTADHHTLTVNIQAGIFELREVYITSGDGNLRCAVWYTQLICISPMISAPALDDIKIENDHPNITYFLSNGTKFENYHQIFNPQIFPSITASGASTAVLSNGTSLYPYIDNGTPPPSDRDPTPYANISFHGVFFTRLNVTALIICT
jgi:hypothetical protein